MKTGFSENLKINENKLILGKGDMMIFIKVARIGDMKKVLKKLLLTRAKNGPVQYIFIQK